MDSTSSNQGSVTAAPVEQEEENEDEGLADQQDAEEDSASGTVAERTIDFFFADDNASTGNSDDKLFEESMAQSNEMLKRTMCSEIFTNILDKMLAIDDDTLTTQDKVKMAEDMAEKYITCEI